MQILHWFCGLTVSCALCTPGMAQAGVLGYDAAGSTDYTSGGMRRIGGLKLSDAVSSSNVRSLYSAAMDPSTGYAVFATAALINPGRVIKVDLNGTTPVQVAVTSCGLGDVNLISAAVDASDPDPANHYAYFGTATSPGRIVKVALGAGNSAPVYVGSVALSAAPPAENGAFGIVLDTTDRDPAKHCAYIACNTSPALVVKVLLGVGAALPTRVGATSLNKGEGRLRRVVADLSDAANRYAYFAGALFLAKIRLGEGSDFRRIGVAPLNADETPIGSLVADVSNLDPSKRYAYLGTYNPSVSTARLVKVKMGAGNAVPQRIGSVLLNSGERELSSAVIDAAAGHAFFSCDHTHPARVYKLRLGSGDSLPVEASPLRLARGTRSYPVSDGGNISAANADWYGEIYVQSSVYDAARGFAYWGTDTVPGQVVKVAVSPKGAIHATRVSLTETAAVSAAHFYSHSAGGSVRLGVYSHGEPRTLLWQSGAIANTNAGTWIVLPIASGTPPNLTLSPGTYWLAWQTDSTADVAGRTTGAGGDSFYLNQDFGPFPATIRGTDIVAGSERWSMYLEYVAASAASRWSSLD